MSAKIDTLLGWHFCSEDKRLGYDDGREIIEGETLRVESNPVLCENGLHASERIIDALKYAPGPILCRIELFDSIVRGKDKAVARERKTLWMFDATNALRDFAATVAENALLAERAAGREPDPRSWAAVQFVRDLLAGKVKEEDQEATSSAARSAAWSAAQSSWSTTTSARLRSARAAAESAAWSAAESAATVATAARAAYSAAESAWWSAEAARSAAEAAEAAEWARSEQNVLLLQIIEKWRNK